jgi:hypothetical protein
MVLLISVRVHAEPSSFAELLLPGPSQITLPRSRRMEPCACVFPISRKPASTAAFLVWAPLHRIASRINLSSVSILAA